MSASHPISTDVQVSVLSEYDADGFLGIGLDGESATVKDPPIEAFHPFGFLGRPRDPTTDDEGNADPAFACNVLRLSEGSMDHCMVLNDPRTMRRLLMVPKGGSLQYADTGKADLPYVFASGDDGTLKLHVAADATVTIEVAGGPTIFIDNGTVQVGAPGGAPAVKDPGSLTAFFQGLSTATGVPMPAGYLATKVKVT